MLRSCSSALPRLLVALCLGCTPDFVEAVTLGEAGGDDATSGPANTSTSAATSSGETSTATSSSTGTDASTGTTADASTTAITGADSSSTGVSASTSEGSSSGDGTSSGDASTSTGSSSSSGASTDGSSSGGDTCGNGTIEEPETCDGSDLAGRDCETQGFASGVLACRPDCSAFDTTGCVPIVCGDGMQAGTEVCDGADLGTDCNGLGFDGGTLACLPDCTDYDTSGCTSCGDGVLAGTEDCDGVDLGGATCVSLGYGGGALACAADCSYDVGECVVLLAESEPNDDGAVAVGTNDFSAAAADGPFTTDVLVSAAIAPAGDDDVFAVTNPGTTHVLLRVETFGAGGVGTCAGGVNTFVEVRTALGQLLASDDNAGIASCSLVTGVPIAPGETRYVRVIEAGDDAPIAAYMLSLSTTPVVCGDGVPGPGEQCDDGANVDGDGCSGGCLVEGAIAEIEPNATIGQADATGIVIADDAIIGGALATVGDLDRFRLDVAVEGVVRLESFTSTGACNATVALRVYDDLGAELVADTASSGIGGCGALVVPLVVGTYYVQVEEIGQNAIVPTYLLEAAFLADNGTEAEPNDVIGQADVNLSGASSDVYVFGDHSDNADSDFYEIDVPTDGLSLRLELVEGDRATETCESSGIDSRITLYDGTGVQLLEDDNNGRGACSLVDGTGTSPANPAAHGLAAGTYYVQVRESGSASIAGGQFSYRLIVTMR